MKDKKSSKRPGPTEADFVMEFSKTLKIISHHKQLYDKKLQRAEIQFYKLYVCRYAVPRDVYGSAARQELLAKACICYEREVKKYPLLTLTDLDDILWSKYRFFKHENSHELISFGTLKSDTERAHALLNQPVEMIEGTRSCIKNAFCGLKKVKRASGKIMLTPLVSMSLQEIDIVGWCVCA